ncbi:unnamed protein product [Moneuplotes crassus]|uniref:small monomeric GTPase n=1 Tax=Euplotes crassus TaxID=5936 RepID=A0AAD1UBY3_EUPCR|nr:unnamed protein product [Moneuplotes crassus]
MEFKKLAIDKKDLSIKSKWMEKVSSCIKVKFKITCSTPQTNFKIIFLLYDITSLLSFHQASQILQLLRKGKFWPEIVLLGNKTDCEGSREVAFERGMKLAVKYGAYFTEISVKKVLNLKEIFGMVAHSAVMANLEDIGPEYAMMLNLEKESF